MTGRDLIILLMFTSLFIGVGIGLLLGAGKWREAEVQCGQAHYDSVTGEFIEQGKK